MTAPAGSVTTPVRVRGDRVEGDQQRDVGRAVGRRPATGRTPRRPPRRTPCQRRPSPPHQGQQQPRLEGSTPRGAIRRDGPAPGPPEQDRRQVASPTVGGSRAASAAAAAPPSARGRAGLPPASRSPAVGGVAPITRPVARSITAAPAERHSGIQAQDGEARPWRQHTGRLVKPEDRLTCIARQVAGHRVRRAGGQDPGEDRQHQQDSQDGGDAARRRTDQRPDRHAQHRQHGEVRGAAQHRPCDPGIAQRRGRQSPRRQDRLAEQESGHGRGGHRHPDHRRVHGGLGPQDRQTPRYRRERGADHAGRVLPAHHQDAESADRELRETGSRSCWSATGATPFAGGEQRDQRAQADQPPPLRRPE